MVRTTVEQVQGALPGVSLRRFPFDGGFLTVLESIDRAVDDLGRSVSEMSRLSFLIKTELEAGELTVDGRQAVRNREFEIVSLRITPDAASLRDLRIAVEQISAAFAGHYLDAVASRSRGGIALAKSA